VALYAANPVESVGDTLLCVATRSRAMDFTPANDHQHESFTYIKAPTVGGNDQICAVRLPTLQRNGWGVHVILRHFAIDANIDPKTQC
jgi:hypothetical protein